MTRVVLVPGVPALLPAYRSLEDPVAPLRAACLDAVAWLGPAPRIVADPQGARVAAALLESAGSRSRSDGLDTLAGARGSTGGAARAVTVGDARGSTGGAARGSTAGGARAAADGGAGGRGSTAGGARAATDGGAGGRAARPPAAERVETPRAEESILVVGNGSARRTDSSPGPFDPRAVLFDDALGSALRGPDPAALRSLDGPLADELWASIGSLDQLADLLEGASLVGVDYDEAPYGVQYWVMRWRA